MIMLSPSQKRAEKAFFQFLDNNNENTLIIAGFAGSGKSYLIKHLYNAALSYFTMKKSVEPNFTALPIYFTATTNKAAGVLQNFVNMPAQTIHSLLGLKVKNNFDTGKTTLEPTERTRPHKALIFIDEASMIDKKLYAVIREYTQDSKVVFIGDNYQLPPVFENGSIVFKNKNTVFLEEIQRQVAHNPIILLSQKYRNIIDTGPPFTWPEIVPDNKHIFTVDGHDFEQIVRNCYSQKHNPDDYKILAYTNKKVIAYNKFVRQLYTNSNDFQAGEYVMTNKPILRGNTIIYPTDSVIQITKVEPTIVDNLPGFFISFKGIKNQFYPKNWAEANALMKHYKKHYQWRDFFRIKEHYLDIRSLHALTCHKAQGSTYREVFIDLNDIGTNNKYYEAARLVYVAITRASDKVYLYGRLPDKWVG